MTIGGDGCGKVWKMKRRRATPTFFWQAVFILLPVMVMAGFGFRAILHQRRLVEQDARARAEEILRGLPNDFGARAAADLVPLNAGASGWLNFLENVAARWPTDPFRQQMLRNTNELQAVSNITAVLQSASPGWMGDIPPVDNFLLSGDATPEWPPHPPEWLTAMTDQQRPVWTRLTLADLAGESSSNVAILAADLNDAAPPADAATCAEFFVLRARTREAQTTNAADALVDFARQHPAVVSESGLRLPTLALGEVLRPGAKYGPTEKVWNALRTESLQGGFLAPKLLEEAAKLAAGNAQLTESVKAMRLCLAEGQRRQELEAGLALAGCNSKSAPTNLWLNAQNCRWLCLVRPREIMSANTASTGPLILTNVQLEVSCYPEPVVSQTFANALSQVRTALPNYFALACEVEGEPLRLPAGWSKAAGDPPDGDVLAEAHFPRIFPLNRTMADTTPVQPMVTVRLLLVNRHLLYTRQRQLQWTFGSLIVLSLGTAIVGFVAARRAFQRQLQLNEQKSNFVSSVSHELRAPIASVRLMAENLERGKISEPDRQGEYFRFIVQECRRLSSLIENVLDISRIEQGRKQYEFEPTDLVALAETTVKLMEPYAAEKGVRLEFHSALGNSHTEFHLDGRAIQQALVNLIDNAIKHSPKAEAVTVGLEGGAEGAPVRLWVADRGPGIPPAEQDKIFERFHRLGSELRRETPGVGIGLSIVKHIVQAHGGRVMVESKVGQGAGFIIELPNRPAT